MPKHTFQYKTTISVNRTTFIDTVVLNPNIRRKDYRVLLHLLTHLDSMSFREVSKKHIAETLGMTKSEVSEAIDNLIAEEILDIGSSATVKSGYKLLF